jgi:hypothetical protein
MGSHITYIKMYIKFKMLKNVYFIKYIFLHNFSVGNKFLSILMVKTDPEPLPKRIYKVLPLSIYSVLSLSLTSYSSCLRLLPRLPVISILPSTFPSVTCFRRQFLRKTLLFQFDFHLFFIVCMMYLSLLTLCDTYVFLTESVQLVFSILPQHHISKFSRC